MGLCKWLVAAFLGLAAPPTKPRDPARGPVFPAAGVMADTSPGPRFAPWSAR